MMIKFIIAFFPPKRPRTIASAAGIPNAVAARPVNAATTIERVMADSQIGSSKYVRYQRVVHRSGGQPRKDDLENETGIRNRTGAIRNPIATTTKAVRNGPAPAPGGC